MKFLTPEDEAAWRKERRERIRSLRAYLFSSACPHAMPIPAPKKERR